MTRKSQITTGAVAGLVAVVLAGCGGSNESAAPSEPTTVTVTTTEPVTTKTVPAEPEDSTSLYDYPRGYPKKVPISSVPDNMSLYSGAEDGLKVAVAVAPGVWVRREAGTTIRENADYGSLFGWCASVRKFQRQTGRGLSSGEGSTCW